MSPNPEQTGPGVFSKEKEVELEELKSRIDTILTEGVSSIANQRAVEFVGLACDRDPKNGNEYLHPVLYVSYQSYDIYDEGEHSWVAIGGNNFSGPFILDFNTNEIYWGENIGTIKYNRGDNEKEPDPLRDFFEGEEDYFLFFIMEMYQRLRLIDIDRAEELKEGKVADYLIPKTVDSMKKLERARSILAGLERARGNIVENNQGQD